MDDFLLSIDLAGHWYLSDVFGRQFAIRRRKGRALGEKKLYEPIRNALERYFAAGPKIVGSTLLQNP